MPKDLFHSFWAAKNFFLTFSLAQIPFDSINYKPDWALKLVYNIRIHYVCYVEM